MKIATAKHLWTLGWCLLLIAGALALLWFYWLAPMRHLNDSDWIKAHSMRQVWIETQRQIHRTGVDHNGSLEIGRFGDKTWAEWLIQKIKAIKDAKHGMISCGRWPYHLDTALWDITNQRMTNADNWLFWWEQNKDKNQADWIREGFAQNGIVLQQPLTTNNIIALLKLVNVVPPHAGSTNQFLLSMRYNALRWLRDSDSGFTAANFNLKNIPDEEKEQITLALIQYAQWLGENWNSPGKLPIGGSQDYSLDLEPNFATYKYVCLAVYLLLSLLAAGGIGLIFYSSQKNAVDK